MVRRGTYEIHHFHRLQQIEDEIKVKTKVMTYFTQIKQVLRINGAFHINSKFPTMQESSPKTGGEVHSRQQDYRSLQRALQQDTL